MLLVSLVDLCPPFVIPEGGAPTAFPFYYRTFVLSRAR